MDSPRIWPVMRKSFFILWCYNDYTSIIVHCVFIIPCNCWLLPLQTNGPYKHQNYPPTTENHFFQWPCRAPYYNVTSGRPCIITSAIWTYIGRVFPINKFTYELFNDLPLLLMGAAKFCLQCIASRILPHPSVIKGCHWTINSLVVQ